MSPSLYDTVVAAHVLVSIAAWGTLLAWPWLPGRHGDAHAQRALLLGVVVTRAAIVALLTGMVLAYDRSLFGQAWVLVPLVVLVILLGVVGGVLTPRERRLAALADAEDWEAWERLNRTVTRIAGACAPLIALAVVMMVLKPG